LGGSEHTVKENAENLVVAGKDIALEINVDKTKYMFMSRDKNAGRSRSKKFEIIRFEILEEFKYFVKDFNNSILYSPRNQEQIEFSECLLSFVAESFVLKISIQKFEGLDIQNYNFAFVLYGCETWTLTLREERKLTLFENRVLRSIIVTKMDKERIEPRKRNNDNIHDMYRFPNILRVIKLRKM